ncbi:sugar-binding transcriptional regulator [Brevibacillus daliensis]|uniref:sugar-binding transcriptional regulator n=1 Tax=Brevibacillus daliensis TaxID=2892995 RepID=UPI001E493F25|nr:sugar-binding transcriptional regulator [Brevibacillus daliensis]
MDLQKINTDERKLLARVARMYYDQNLTQNQIAQELGIYRTTIGRMIKKAREDGIVEIIIHDDFDSSVNLAYQVESHFGLKEVILVSKETVLRSNRDKVQLIAEAAMDLLDRIVKDGDTLGIAWGSTMSSLVNAKPISRKRKIRVVPLVGGQGNFERGDQKHLSEILHGLASNFGGEAYYIDAASTAETKEIRDQIYQSKYLQKIRELWNEIDISIVGIGAPISNSNLIWQGFFGEETIEELKKFQAVGDICSRFYDVDGHIVNSDVYERTVGIELQQMKQMRYSIGVAESSAKVNSILGALRGGYINTLVTTEETAKALLRADKKRKRDEEKQ